MTTVVALNPEDSSRPAAKPADKQRAPWSGGLSEEELSRPGGVLLAMLIGRANEVGHQLGDMARELGVTYGYIAQLRGGHRETKHISDIFATACANYLGVPRITVLLAAGRVTPEDIFEEPFEVSRALPRAIEFMKRDPQFGPLMPTELLMGKASAQMQFFVVSLYEKATGRTLLPGKHDLQSVATEIAQFQAVAAQRRAEVETEFVRKQRTPKE